MNLRSELPSFYNNNITGPIQDSFSIEATILNECVEDVLNQFFIDKATWGLDLWEDMYRIKKNNLDIQTRRENLKAKKRIKGRTKKVTIKNVCEAYSNGEVDVIMHKEEQYIEIIFVGSIGIPAGFDEMDKTIERIKPCHLDHTYKFTYNNHGDLSKYTHEELAKYTHEELRNSKELRGEN